VSRTEREPVSFPRVERHPPLADTIAEMLLQTILSRHMEPGDELPSERRLSGQFGVSRTVVREALRSLAARGVIDMRPSASAVVAAVDSSTVSEAMGLFLHSTSDTSYTQVYEMRAYVEPELARLAAERATEDDIRHLRSSYDRLVATAQPLLRPRGTQNEDAVRACALADLDFHLQVARASHNVFYLILLDSIRDIQIAMRVRTMTEPGDAELIPGEHGAVMEAIAAGDPARARATMAAHLSLTDLPERWAASQPGGLVSDASR